MTEPAAPSPEPDKNLVTRGTDGDPLPHPSATRMIEYESYERVVEGLKMAADACVHLAKMEMEFNQTWKDVGKRLDEIRLEAVKLAALDLPMKQLETPEVRGEPVAWRSARGRFLDGLKQATGGMRQLAVCHRGDLRWSMKAQELERGNNFFRALLRGKPLLPTPRARLIVPGMGSR